LENPVQLVFCGTKSRRSWPDLAGLGLDGQEGVRIGLWSSETAASFFFGFVDTLQPD